MRIGKTEEPQASGIFEVEDTRSLNTKSVSARQTTCRSVKRRSLRLKPIFLGEPVAKATVKYYIYRSRYYHFWWRNDEDDPLAMSGGGEDEDEGGGFGYGYGNDLAGWRGQARCQRQARVEFEVPPPDEKGLGLYLPP